MRRKRILTNKIFSKLDIKGELLRDQIRMNALFAAHKNM